MKDWQQKIGVIESLTEDAAGLHVTARLVPTYRPWSTWKRRRVHARWWLADRVHSFAYRIGGDQ